MVGCRRRRRNASSGPTLLAQKVVRPTPRDCHTEVAPDSKARRCRVKRRCVITRPSVSPYGLSLRAAAAKVSGVQRGSALVVARGRPAGALPRCDVARVGGVAKWGSSAICGMDVATDRRASATAIRKAAQSRASGPPCQASTRTCERPDRRLAQPLMRNDRLGESDR
jgi:hypothetical protein